MEEKYNTGSSMTCILSHLKGNCHKTAGKGKLVNLEKTKPVWYNCNDEIESIIDIMTAAFVQHS